MPVCVRFKCSGCTEEADGTDWLHRNNNYQASLVAPDGWVAFDPWTKCCYCPECWAEIMAPNEDATREIGEERDE